jgi:hypothetical protein
LTKSCPGRFSCRIGLKFAYARSSYFQRCFRIRPASLLYTAICLASTGAAATQPFAGADEFVRANCVACHSSAAPAARLDLSKLNYEPANRERLDQYFTSVRELENRLQQSKGWERKPKPVVKEPEPQDPASPAQYMAKVANMYSLVRLAVETDSTRSVTLMLDSVSTPVVEIKGATISDGYRFTPVAENRN